MFRFRAAFRLSGVCSFLSVQRSFDLGIRDRLRPSIAFVKFSNGDNGLVFTGVSYRTLRTLEETLKMTDETARVKASLMEAFN